MMTQSRTNRSSTAFSRRTLVGASLASAATAMLPQGSTPARVARQEEASDPATWHTWILSSPDELRPPASSDPTPAEIAEVLELQAALTDEEAATMRSWLLRPAVLPWTEVGTAALDEFLSPTR